MNVRLFLRRGRLALVFAALAALSPLRAQRMELADTTARPVIVESAAIRTEITGRLAVTTFDLVFRNPNSRLLEGTFTFPLLDGQSIVRFGLDIDGKLRDATPIEKTRGRVIFEEIQRRRVDPGLLEQTEGNNYRARIFPIPAGGTRRIVIAYQEDVARAGPAATYRLALDLPEKLKYLSLSLHVFTGGKTPARVSSSLPLNLPDWREGRTLEASAQDVPAKGLLEIALPPLDYPALITGSAGNEEYFYAEIPAAKIPAVARPAPKIIGLLWDASGSGAARDHEREFALLDAWFSTVKEVDVQLVFLRDKATASQRFAVTKGNWSKLKSELQKVAYDGATGLDGLAEFAPVDEWLVFSDGLVNYGATARHARLPLQGAVHTVLASPQADPAWLRATARRHDGEFVNLLELSATDSAQRLRTHSPRLLDVDSSPSEVAEVYPEIGTPLSSGPLVVTGLLRSPRATLRLRLGHAGGQTEEIKLAVRSGINATPLAARGWATAKIDQLSIDAAANREDIRRTAQAFGIVTADTSLLVLETLADYVLYDVEPPEEMRPQWVAQRRGTQQPFGKTPDYHLSRMVQIFEERIAWWEKKFPKDGLPTYRNSPPRSHGQNVWSFGAATPARPDPSNSLGPSTSQGPVTSGAAPGDGEVIQLQAFSVSNERSGSARAVSRTRGAPTASAPAPAAPPSLAFHAADLGTSATGSSEPPASGGDITLQRWEPDAGYLARLRRAAPDRAYRIYLEERATRTRQPGFFLDAAAFFFEQKAPDLALRVLSNLAELALEDVALLRVLAHRLTQADRPDLALPIFERVLALRPDEPQSRRDVALACADLKQTQRAIDLLWEIVSQPCDFRFEGIQLTALTELNAIAATSATPVDLSRVDPRLRKNLPVSTRVVLTWDANDCDIDLWVLDPNGERAKYDFPLTFQGGLMSRDFTAGYGPEEFVLRDPKPGHYAVSIDYYGDSRQTALGPVTAQVRFITGFGTGEQTEKRTTLRLTNKKQTREAGAFDIGDPRVGLKE